MTKGGKMMRPEELERINLECDLMNMINRHAWPHGEKIVRELLQSYFVEPKQQRAVAILAKPE